MYICSKCGRDLGQPKKFCPYCGTKQTVAPDLLASDEIFRKTSGTPGAPARGNRNYAYEDKGASSYDRRDSLYDGGRPSYGYPPEPMGTPGYSPEGKGDDQGIGRILIPILIAFLCFAIIGASAFLIVRMRQNEKADAQTEAVSEVDDANDAGDEENVEDEDVISDEDAVQDEDKEDEEVNAPTGMEPTYLTKKFSSREGLEFYAGPDGNKKISVDNDYKKTVPEGVFVAYLGEEGDRTKVWYAGICGWVDSSELDYFSDDAYYLYDDDLSEKIYQAYDLKSNGGIAPHSEPNGLDSSKLDDTYRIPYGREFTVEALENGFAMISWKGEECWVDMHYFRTYARYTKWWVMDNQSQDHGKLKTSPDAYSKTKAKISNGSPVTVTEIKDGWGKISYEGKEGWVQMKILSPEIQ